MARAAVEQVQKAWDSWPEDDRVTLLLRAEAALRHRRDPLDLEAMAAVRDWRMARQMADDEPKP